MTSSLNIMEVLDKRSSVTHQLYAQDLVITAVICFIGEKLHFIKKEIIGWSVTIRNIPFKFIFKIYYCTQYLYEDYEVQ